MNGIKEWLAHPLAEGVDLDDPKTTALRRRIIREKPFLRKIYLEWYEALATALPPGDGAVLELGSGGGFLREIIPGLVTSDVFEGPGIDLVLDATATWPFEAGALCGVVMTNVLHHIPKPRRFFAEAARCVRPGGKMVMVEPWVSAWSRLIYGRLHHEPFQPEAADWTFPQRGPLTGANGALPWILFARDREQFEDAFPQWAIRSLTPGMPFRYLLSGGVSLRPLMPGWTHGFWRGVEQALRPWMGALAMFALVELERTAVGREQPSELKGARVF